MRPSRLAVVSALAAAGLAAGALAGAPAPARAQAPAGLAGAVPVGARVRVVLPDSLRQAALGPRAQVVIGTAAAVSGDTLTLAVPGAGGTLRVARADLRALDVSRGVPARAVSGLLDGARLALSFGLLFALFHDLDDSPPFDGAGSAALVGAGAGFTVGFVVGAASPSERWRRVRLR